MSALHALLAHLQETDAFNAAARLLQWDQETGMPAGGEAARAETLAVISRHVHERSTSARLEELLAAAEAEAADPADRRQCQLVRRDLERARRVPGRLVEEIVRATSLGQQVWARARAARDFQAFRPHLETIVALKREEGACLSGPDDTPYDGLLSDYEWGMRATDWEAVFARLEGELPALVGEILARSEETGRRLDRLAALSGPFPRDRQMAACRRLAEGIGFDFSRGRLDLSAHPFSETVHAGDQRITTRLDESELTGSLFSVLHETGHALYEQGLPAELAGTPLGSYASMAVHESQSRLWENLVGRSRTYWEVEYPALVADFPVLADVPLDDWISHVQRVRRSLVRTESDEATYNLHVLLRFRLERALIGQDLTVAELPGAWDDGLERLLGVRPSHVGEGCLQDVHWSAGMFGYFPTYTLGNLLSAQFHAAARAAGAADDRVALLGWLRREVHARGRALETADLVREVTGSGPDAGPFLAHLRSRYLG